MFYFKNWEIFCKRLKNSGITICTAEQSLSQPKNHKYIVLKHDVETFVPNAHKLASIEHKYGLCTTYYVQAYLIKDSKNVELLREMQSWGHEISYHYDVLDANAGDYDKADRDFNKFLNDFINLGFKFKTICQHGNPVKNRVGYHSNRDFFRNEKIRNEYPDLVDMVVNYSKYAPNKYNYISDASYRWNVITEPETNDLHPDAKNIRIGGFDNLFNLVTKDNTSYVISTHPHRWKTSAFKIYLKIFIFRIIRSVVMFLKHIPGIDLILNKFYFLAKKI